MRDIEDFDAVGQRTTTSIVSVSYRSRDKGADAEQPDAAADFLRPGQARIWVKTFGCSHNVSDGEYMMGQLAAHGYTLVPDAQRDSANAWLINSCTVKSPSQSAMANIIAAGRAAGKAILVAGCVPQSDRRATELQGLSLLGVTQIDRVVEAVEQALQGHTVVMLEKKALPKLDLPKVRKNRHVEIIPLSTGCLGACTYWYAVCMCVQQSTHISRSKTKHARGHLGSYAPEAIQQRVAQAASDPDVRTFMVIT